VIPFIPLSKILDGTQGIPRNWTAVVVAGAGGMAAIGVDRLLDTAAIVVRPLPEDTPASAIVGGVMLDAEGNPQLVLDPDGVVVEAQRRDAAAPEPARPERPVLVVDDSLTTRMLEQSILESAGYDVDVAVSGEEAVERLRLKQYALFLVDVDMPGMDGFTFIERVRSDPAFHKIPAILVTSRSSSEDRQRGQDVGAQGYIVKSEFDQAKLLTLIDSLTA
jgi:two-component system, chemotaxis family, sensor kinase CheA